MTTTPDLPIHKKDAKLDRLLDELGATYRRQPIPAQALERLERRFELENRQLSEQDLQWLAAAGTLTPLSDIKDLP